MAYELKSGAHTKLLNIFTSLYITILVLVPSVASKFIAIGPLTIGGATLIFPITYIFNNILTEVYGYTLSRRVIWTGMFCSAFSALVYWFVGAMPPAAFLHNQEAYDAILGTAPRIVAASLAAYFFGEFANSYVLSKLKFLQKGKSGKYQAGRFVASTIVCEFFDTVIFFLGGFYGVIATPDLARTMLTIWLVKIAYEIIALPLTLKFTNWVKKVENMDAIDRPGHVNYNPFALTV